LSQSLNVKLSDHQNILPTIGCNFMGKWKRKKKEPSFYLLTFFVVIFFSCILSSDEAYAQGNAKASYKKGLKTDNIEQKISHFKRAIELDQTFTKAYFELGKALESTGALDEALMNLKRALMAKPSDLDDQLRFNIVHKIGAIQRKMGRLSEAKKSLSGATNLTSDSKIQADIYKELAEINKELGFIDEAIECYEKAGRLNPKEATTLTQSISSLQEKKQLYQSYNEGIKHLERERYQEAIAVLQKVVLADTNFKDARARLDEAQEKVNQIQQTNEWEQLYKKGVGYLAEHNWNQAENSFRQLMEKKPDYKDTRKLLFEAQNASKENMKQRNINRLYRQGIRHFRNRNWTKAIVAFEEIHKIEPDYLDVNQKLKQAQTQLENQGLEAVKLQYYTQGVDAYRIQDWENAIAIFERLVNIDPQYQDIQELLNKAKNAHAQQTDNNECAQLYQSGIDYMKQEDWINAAIAFEKVMMLNPEYEQVQAFLAEARVELKKKEKLTTKERVVTSDEQKINWLPIGLIAAFIFIAISSFLLAPPIRGKLYLRQGKYEKASRIYERLLGKDPGNPKLSLILADIYHNLEREDEKAVKVYEAVLKQNLDTPIKRDISAIVAYYYLSKGNAEEAKIDILEQALSGETIKLHSTKG